MPFRDDGRGRGTSAGRRGSDVSRDWFEGALGRFLPRRIFAGLPRHGNRNWSLHALATAALFWALSSEETLGDRFDEAQLALRRRRPRLKPVSLQAFRKALRNWTERLLAVLVPRLRRRMKRLAAWTVGGWAVFGVDGTRLDLPRTRTNERRFLGKRPRGRSRRAANRGRRNSRAHLEQERPQLFLTLLWQVGLRMPWAWRIGPLSASERHEFRDLLPTLPEGSLVVADAGFTGYDLWRELLAAGHEFVIRVGSNLRLLRDLGYHVREREGIVSLWPDAARRRWEPPLVLRLIEFRTARRTVSLVTSVLQPRRLPERRAVAIYRARWGIEVWIRGFKQTYGRTKLRSHAAHNVPHELDWSIVALWIAELWATEQLAPHGVPPDRLGTAPLLRTVRRATFHRATLHPPAHTSDDLAWSTLKDAHVRRAPKTRRRPPRRKHDPAAGPPKITTATPTQRRTAALIRTIKAL